MFKNLFNLFTKKDGISNHIVKTELSIVEYTAFVDEVASKCFVETEYHPEYLKPMFALSVLRTFTDIKPTMMKEEDGTESTYVDTETTFKYCNDNFIVDKVSNKCSFGYISNLFDLVIESLEYKKAMMIAQTSNVSEQVVLGFVELLDVAKQAVLNFDMSKSKEIFEFLGKVNASGATKLDLMDAIAKNVAEKANEEKSNVAPISPIANVLGD